MWRVDRLASLIVPACKKHISNPLATSFVETSAKGDGVLTYAWGFARAFSSSDEDGNSRPAGLGDDQGTTTSSSGQQAPSSRADAEVVTGSSETNAAGSAGAPVDNGRQGSAAQGGIGGNASRPPTWDDGIPAAVHAAIEHRYGAWGITAEQLMNFLDVHLDIQDARIQGHVPQLDPERYKRYKDTLTLLEKGPEITEEEREWLARNLKYDVVNQPWPTNLRRNWVRQDTGSHLQRFKKYTATTYDQGWLTEALFPFDSIDDMAEHLTGLPDLENDSNGKFYPDELQDDIIIRRPRKTPGTPLMLDWAEVLHTAHGTLLSPEASEADDSEASPAAAAPADAELTGEGAEEDAAHAESDSAAEASAASGAADAEEGDALDAADDEDVDALELGDDEDGDALELADDEDVSMEDAAAALWAGLEHLDDGAEIPNEVLGLTESQEGAEALVSALYEEQTASLLRRKGYGEHERERFMADHGLSEDDFDAVVEEEVTKQLDAYSTPDLELRSPEELLEDMVPAKSRVRFFGSPLYDLRDHIERQPDGVFTPEFAIPEMFREESLDPNPGMLQHFREGLLGDVADEQVVPDICRWEQVMWLHTGPRNWHPGNKRVALTVHVHDLQRRYALSDKATQYLIKLAGTRYNKANGELRLACQRHRHREENRRQAMHWMLKLVEAAHLKHPNPAWEVVKQQQQQYLQTVLSE